ncbi:MAG: HEPN domain-containing protein [Planctomycetota bacterium]
MSERSADWLNQARRDLENARWEIKGGYYEWASFICQQAAEKALKAVYQKLGGECWGHSIVNLLTGLKEKISVSENIIQVGRILDRFYITTRYPNGWSSGIPKDYYTEKDAQDALISAEEIIRFCESFLA